MTLEMLKETLRRAPVLDVDGYQYFVHPVTDGIPFLTKTMLDEVVEHLETVLDLSDVDKIVTVEAMGIPIAVPLTQRTGVPTVVVRKRSYGLPGEYEVSQQTGYRGKTPLYINGLRSGDRVIFVDDVLSTGGTLVPIMKAFSEMNIKVAEVVIVFNKHKDLKALEETIDHEIKTLVDVDIVDGHVVIQD